MRSLFRVNWDVEIKTRKLRHVDVQAAASTANISHIYSYLQTSQYFSECFLTLKQVEMSNLNSLFD